MVEAELKKIWKKARSQYNEEMNERMVRALKISRHTKTRKNTVKSQLALSSLDLF